MSSSLSTIRETARCEVLPPDICAAKCLPTITDGPGPQTAFSCGDFWQVAHCCNGSETHTILQADYRNCTCSGMLTIPASSTSNQTSILKRSLCTKTNCCLFLSNPSSAFGFVIEFFSGWIDWPCACCHHRTGFLFPLCRSIRILVYPAG